MHIGAKHGTFNFIQSRYGSATVLPDLRITVTVNNGDHGDVVREYDEVDHIHEASRSAIRTLSSITGNRSGPLRWLRMSG